jgi:3-oxoacyl-[acyl-carrier protein] reductase
MTGTSLDFTGKTVLVTGAASGFGAATAARFAAHGARVAVADINEAGARELAATLPGAIALGVDVAVASQVEAMVSSCAAAWGHLDVLVNNAGVPHRKTALVDMDAETFDRQFTINVRSVFLGIKYAVPHMPDGGAIVNTSSIGAVRPRPGLTAYNASKGAVNTLTRGAAAELAPRIRVNAVCPVAAQTGFVSSANGVDTMPDALRAAVVAQIPMGRIAEPEDVAAAIMFLASSEARVLTGVCLDVDGGRGIS